MSDLRDLLQERNGRLALSLRDAPEFDVAAAGGAIRRRRRTRGAVETVGAFAGVAVIGTLGWLGYDASRVDVAVTPTPTPSASPSASPTPSPSPSPSVTEEPHQIVSGDDVAILERLQNPTTGETWHEPVEIARPSALADAFGNPTFYEVGTHGEATIVIAVNEESYYFDDGYALDAMYEITGDTAALIACPSTRSTDACLERVTPAGVVLDTDTHYDSLTYPLQVDPVADWPIHTAMLASDRGYWSASAAFGNANAFTPGAAEEGWPGTGSSTTLAQLGQSRLVVFDGPGPVPGTSEARYAIVTPYGGTILLGTHATGGGTSLPAWGYYGVGAVTWNDQADTFTHEDASTDSDEGSRPFGAVAPTEHCFGGDELIDTRHDDADWVEAGTGLLGQRVFLPAEGGNAVTRALYDLKVEASWDDVIDGLDLSYPYDSYDDFLAARSLFSWQRPDGAWVLGLDSYALERVYECA